MGEDRRPADSPAPVPVGAVILWAGGWSDPVPAGWLACAGGQCPDTAPDLRALLLSGDCRFGKADGVPCLPDLGGLFVRGVQLADSADGHDPDWAGRRAPWDWQLPQRGVGSVQPQTIAAHTHQYVKFPSGPGNATSAGETTGQYMDNPATTHTAGDETRPVNVSFIYLIKAAREPHEVPPVGTIVMYAGDANSVAGLDGWYECDGLGFDSGTYRALSAVLPGGVRPSLRGLFARGVDPATPPVADHDRDRTRFPHTGALSLQLPALQAHDHQVEVANYEGYDAHHFYGVWGPGGWGAQYAPTGISPDPTSGDGKETRPANIALYFIVSSGMRDSAAQPVQGN